MYCSSSIVTRFIGIGRSCAIVIGSGTRVCVGDRHDHARIVDRSGRSRGHANGFDAARNGHVVATTRIGHEIASAIANGIVLATLAAASYPCPSTCLAWASARVA